MADYAESLALTYLKKGECSRDWKDYLKAHGLANYCVAVDSTPERCRLVYDVEVSWYKGNHPISYEEHQQLTNKHKQLLNEYRDEVKSNFLHLDVLGLSLDAEDVYSNENMTNAQKFSDELFELSEKTNDEFARVVRSIIESSVKMLKCIKQDPPCGFVVIGLGSVAKGEATPYSNVKYAFITERDDANYFEMLAMDSYFKIGNLGETPLKCFNIEELKVEKESPPVIADLRTVGFRIDGISRAAGNIPTGNGFEEGLPLTFTVDNLMKLYKTSAESPFAGMADKSDMLSSTVIIYTNEGDESQLYCSFAVERRSYERNAAQNRPAVKKKRMDSFIKDVETFIFLPEFVKYQPPQNMSVRVKTDVFRYPTLLANNIKMFMGWDLRYPWQIYSELYSRNMMSEDTYQYMRIVLSLSIYMRTRAYLHHGSQTEYVSLLPQQMGTVNELYQVPSSLFVVLGCLLVPIKRSVKSNIENIALTADDTSLADTIDSVMQHIELDKTNHMSKVEICYFAGEYEIAKRELSKAIGAPIESTTSTEFLDKIQQTIEDSTSVKRYMELCCYILYHTRSYRAATDFFSWLIDNGQLHMGFWKLLSAHCRKEIGDYRATRQLLDEARQHLVLTQGSYTNSSEKALYTADANHRDMSMSYRDIGTVYREMGEFEAAIKYYKLALEMDIAMFGETAHPDIAADYNGVGCAYIGLGEYTSALDCLFKFLEMMKAIYGAGTNHPDPDIANAYNNIAALYSDRGDYFLSLEYHIKSLKMRKAIYGADTSHPDIANAYNNIAALYSARGDYSLSLEYHIKSLKMRKAIYGADTSHPDIARSYDNIATVYSDCGDYFLSLEYHIKSLEMRKAIYGADTSHPDIASSYNNIATVYHQRGDHTLLLEYNIKSLEMKKAIYGADTNHPDIASSYNNIAVVYSQCGDHALSLKYHIKCLEMRKAIYGANTSNPDIARSYHNIAKVYHQLGDDTLSLEYVIIFLEMVNTILGADTNHFDIANSYNNIAAVYRKRGDYTLSLEYSIKSLEMRKAIYGTDTNHPDIANSYNNVATLHEDRGEYAMAQEYFMKSLEMKKAIYGSNTNHPDIANSYSDVGRLNRQIGKYSSALEWYKKSLSMNKAIYGENHRDIANSYISVGDAYNSLGEHISAIANYRESLEMMEAVYRAAKVWDHPDIANCYDKLARALSENNSPDFTSSLECYKKALEMRKVVYGADTNHPDIVASYNNIGTVHSLVKDYESALRNFKNALSMAKEIYGAETDHPDIADSLNNIGRAELMLDLEHKEPTSTLVYYDRSLEMQLKIYGSSANHPNIADTYARMGDAYAEILAYQPALYFHFKALEMRKAIYIAEAIHPEIALSHSSIGEIYRLLAELSPSLDHLMTSLDMKKEIYEGTYNHFDVATAYEKVASLNCELKRYISALDCYTKALELKKTLYGKNSTNLHIAESYTYIGIVYSHLKEYTKSLDYHTRSLKIRQAKQVDDRPQDVAESYSNIAKAQNCLQNYDKSLENYSKALDIQLGIHRTTDNHNNIATCYSDMAEVYNNMKDHTKALDYYEKCLKMLKDGYGADTNHSDIATCCTNMAMIYTVLGKFSTALEYHTQALTMQQALSDARSKETTSTAMIKGHECESDGVRDTQSTPAKLSSGSSQEPIGITEEKVTQKPSFTSDETPATGQQVNDTGTSTSCQQASMMAEVQAIPQNLTEEISRLCQESSVTSAVLVQDPDDWTSLVVIGVKADLLESKLTDIRNKYQQFTISVEEMDDPLYTEQMTQLFAARRSPAGVGQSDWTGVDETRATVDDKATIEMLVLAEEIKNDSREAEVIHTLYALAPAHMTMDNEQKKKFVSPSWSVEAFRGVVEGQSTNRRYTLRVNDQELYELGHPPLFCYRHWFNLECRSENSVQHGSNGSRHQTPRDSGNLAVKDCECESTGECHHKYMNDIALLKVNLENARDIQQHLAGTEPAQLQRVIRAIPTMSDLEEMHVRRQRIVVRGKDGYFVILPLLPLGQSTTRRIYTKHLTFRLCKDRQGVARELIAGDCGSIVYFQHDDGRCQPMGMFVGKFIKKFPGGPVYQAIVLNQAFDDLECDYPHHLHDIRPFDLSYLNLVPKTPWVP